MSERIDTNANRANLRRQLLITVSALALLASVYGTDKAKAADGDSDRPTVWIELGGQLERIDSSEQRFAPPFILATPRPSVETISPLNVEQPPRYANGAEGEISFQPDDSDWVFSAAIRFGRANGNKHVHQQTYTIPHITFHGVVYAITKKGTKFVDAKRKSNESDVVIDFQAGKDVGLGLFGGKGSSVLGLGVRFAQFAAKSNTAFGSDPDFHFTQYTGPYHFPHGQPYHLNAAHLTATRSFHGLGPSISWNASAPVAGNAQAGEVALDWGLNAAVLFGRQKAIEHHQTTAYYHPPQTYRPRQLLYQTATGHTRSHTVTVPNVGGFAGLSFLYSNAKVSFGYRADFFFGAMDGGIDARKSENTGFYGPFATISVGIGG
jgi:iron complex outermembrane recepter protein